MVIFMRFGVTFNFYLGLDNKFRIVKSVLSSQTMNSTSIVDWINGAFQV